MNENTFSGKKFNRLMEQLEQIAVKNDIPMGSKNNKLPRLESLPMSNPRAPQSDDAAYLDDFLLQVSEAMFPLLDTPPKIDIHTRDAEDESVLHYACTWGNLRAVRLLVEAGANIDALQEMDKTPLHYAAAYQFLDIVEYLVGKGADPSRKDAFGYTPLEWAIQMGASDIENALRKR